MTMCNIFCLKGVQPLNNLFSYYTRYLALKLFFISLVIFSVIISFCLSGYADYYYNNVLIGSGTKDQVHPQIAVSNENHYMIVWEDNTNGSPDIYGVILSTNQSTPYTFPICAEAGNQRNPVIAWDGTNYLVVWEDTRNGASDIYATRIAPNKQILDGTTVPGLPICSANNDQLRPAVVWSGDNYLIVWEDERNSSSKIYAMRVSASLGLLDGNAGTGGIFLGGTGGDQTKPKAAWNGTNFFVVWEHHPDNDTSDIYGTRITPSGDMPDNPGSGLPLGVDDFIKSNLSIASDGEDFFIVWDSYSNDYLHDIVGLLISDEGVPHRFGPFLITENQNNQQAPSIIWCKTNYMVLWKDNRNGIDDKIEVFLVRLNNAGSFLDTATKTNPISLGTVGSSLNNSPPAAIWKEDSAEYIIVWEEYRKDLGYYAYDVYSRRYSAVAPPLLSWTEETNFRDDGVNPDNAPSGSSFEFRVKYQNQYGYEPIQRQLWIDKNDDGQYNPENSEIINMTSDSGTNYLQGIIYKATTTLEYAGDGKISYRFVFWEYSNNAAATGSPTKDSEVNLGNSEALLQWLDSSDYNGDGVNPDTSYGGTSFTLRVLYKDYDNDPPTTKQVWVDLNNNGSYDSDEKFSMDQFDSQSYAEGRTYTKSIQCYYVPN